MGRGSTQVLIRKIIECLAKGPKTISEIAEATELDRTAIGKYVNLLKESGLLVEEQEGTSKKFTIVPTYRTDTYFGLPLEKGAEQQINSVYHLIKKYWAEKTTKKLLNTHAQKIAFKVIKSCKLKIPSGWYIYGGISVATYDDSHEYTYFGLPKDVESCVKEVTQEYAKNDYAWQSKKLQYENAPELYSVKEDILAVLYGPTISATPKNSLHVMIKFVRKLVSLAPKNSREQYVSLLDAFQDLLLDMNSKLDDAIIIEHKRELIMLFEAIWKYIAMFNFKHDLLKYYNEEILIKHFILDIKQQEDEIIELGTYLQSLMPKEKEPSDPLYQQIKDIRKKAQRRTPEEQAKVEKEMKEYEEKHGVEALGEKLRKEFGL